MSTVSVLGASGGVGRLIVDHLLARGHKVIAQSRAAERLARLEGNAEPAIFDPARPDGYAPFLEASEGVIFALGTRKPGATTMFSDATKALLRAMADKGIRRLIAITGVGAGETQGHGGFVYNRLVFPLITRGMYADKERQEALIAASDTDWTIVRPAPFRETAPDTPLQVHNDVPPSLQLTAITRDEVATFVVETFESGAHIRQRPFIGHG